MAKRLGIYGGTFDPVHYGHLLLAESCREQLELDQVLFLPAAVPPHKQRHPLTSPDKRVEMLELAIAGHPGFAVCTHEVQQGGVNFTVDTLAHLERQYPHDELFFLLGADALADLPGWKDPTRIGQLAMLVVVERSAAGAAASDTEAVFHDRGFEQVLDEPHLAAIRQHRVQMPRIDLSSSDIRRRVALGQSIRYRTPRAVEMYIDSQGLYRPEAKAI